MIHPVYAVLVVAITSATLTLALLPAITRIPIQRWERSILVNVAIHAAAWAAVPGVVLALTTQDVTLSIIGAAAGAAVPMLLRWRRYAPMRRIKALTRDLARPERRSRALDEIAEALDESRPDGADPIALSSWAGAVLVSAGHAFDHRELDACERMLERLRGLVLAPVSEVTRECLAAVCHARRGDHGRAGAAMNAASRVTVALPAISLAFRDATQALCAALAGRGSEALRVLDAWAHEAGAVETIRLEARAHACAATGAHEPALQALRDLERRHGREALAFVAAHAGPAQTLARELGGAAPFR